MGTLGDAADSGAAYIQARVDIATTRKLPILPHAIGRVRTYLTYWGHPQPLDTLAAIFFDLATQDTAWRRLHFQEFSFGEGTERLWIPTSARLADSLRAEVAPGDTIWAFVTIHGMVPGPAPKWVLTLDDFVTSAEVGRAGTMLRSCRR